MKLTDENLDYMDCRPLGRETGIEISEELKALIEKREAEKAHAAGQSIPPATE
jgi:hypothetical protein